MLKNQSLQHKEDRYQFYERLGGGAYGNVVLAYDTLDDAWVAIKQVERGSGITQSKYLKKEILMQRKLMHPHIVYLKAVYLTQTHLCIVIEYVLGEDLHTYIKKRGSLTEDEARWFFQQVIMAIDYCHRQGIANRDVKLENCLIAVNKKAKKPMLKMCDFGFSKGPEDSIYQSKVGTVYYMAPEVIDAKSASSYDGSLIDIWSCGVLLYGMLFRSFPFAPMHRGAHNAGVQNYLKGGGGNLIFPEEHPISADCQDLLLQMLVANPSQRITTQSVMEHPWFTKGLPPGFVQFNDICNMQQAFGSQMSANEQSVQEISKLVKQARYTSSYADNFGFSLKDSDIYSKVAQETIHENSQTTYTDSDNFSFLNSDERYTVNGHSTHYNVVNRQHEGNGTTTNCNIANRVQKPHYDQYKAQDNNAEQNNVDTPPVDNYTHTRIDKFVVQNNLPVTRRFLGTKRLPVLGIPNLLYRKHRRIR